jgi:DNA-binding MarR family transcriptional regulator
VSAEPAVRTVFITNDGAPSRRRLGPTAWVVLEALASHAQATGGRVEVTVSARILAAELGVNVDTVTRALRRLQVARIVRSERVRDGGRFAGTRWLLELSRVSGLTIAAEPCEVSPCSVASDTVNLIAASDIRRDVDETAIVDAHRARIARPRRQRTRSVSSPSLFEA